LLSKRLGTKILFQVSQKNANQLYENLRQETIFLVTTLCINSLPVLLLAELHVYLQPSFFPSPYHCLESELTFFQILLSVWLDIFWSCRIVNKIPDMILCYCLLTQGNLKCVKLLLAKGANWKAKDNKGRYVSCLVFWVILAKKKFLQHNSLITKDRKVPIERDNSKS